MGCDIHGYLEILEYPKSERNPWFSTHTIPDKRSYLAFSVFAGVRNQRYNIEPISPPKGMPHDISMIAKWGEEEMAGDSHTHSWLTWREIHEYDWMQDIDGNLLINMIPIHYRALFNEMSFLANTYGADKVRIVFWFDN